MADLERFVNADRGEIPSLLAVAMAHYQFETIHPFRDGNGRIGRALIVHDLCKRGLLDHQVIFLSGYINKHKHRYYETLLGVSTGSAWERWFAFFLDAVIDQARETAVLAKRLFRLRETYIDAVKTNGLPARLLTLIDALFERPIVNARVVAQRLGVTDPTARKDIGLLVEHNVLALTADVAWGQTWFAKGIIDIVETTDDDDEP
jgi:Fic family protein